MVLKVLGSSSHGNSYILENDREALLLEAGVRFASVKQALDYNITKVVGCLITHEHKDHAGYINEVLKATVPVYASAGTIENTPIEGPRRANVCKAGTLFTLGGFRIIPFGTKHDSAEPLGFFINHEETGNILFATDTYYLPCKFAGLNNVLIECNYRLDLLDANIAAGRIPAVVRNRTLKSHLSYDHCVQALQANDIKGVNNIVLIHLSDGNSNAEQFRAGVRAATGKTVHIAEAGLIINFDKTPFDMIKGFDQETQPLNDYEMGVLLPLLVRGLRTKIGRENAVTNKHIVNTLKGSYKLNDARVRKIINHIRTNDLIPGLIATSEGYFIAQSEAELLEYEESLKGREDAIRAVRLSIARQRRILYEQKREEKQSSLFNK